MGRQHRSMKRRSRRPFSCQCLHLREINGIKLVQQIRETIGRGICPAVKLIDKRIQLFWIRFPEFNGEGDQFVLPRRPSSNVLSMVSIPKGSPVLHIIRGPTVFVSGVFGRISKWHKAIRRLLQCAARDGPVGLARSRFFPPTIRITYNLLRLP
jgi:hypothetical protein